MKRSVLLDSGADIISYGMGERSIVEIAGSPAQPLFRYQELTFIRGTVYKTHIAPDGDDVSTSPGFDKISTSKELYAKAFTISISTLTRSRRKRSSARPYQDDHLFVVQNPPQMPLSTEEMDDTYALPYTRTYHPDYEVLGGIPAIEEVKFSLASCRGCSPAHAGLCALTFHQGRIIQSRSHESLLEEAKKMTEDPDFKGYIHDVGGPTANFRKPACKADEGRRVQKPPMSVPGTMPQHGDRPHGLRFPPARKLRALPKVKKVFVRSGIRFDYLINDKDETFFRELVKYHVSGQLKVAPEHISDGVLRMIGKPQNSNLSPLRQAL